MAAQDMSLHVCHEVWPQELPGQERSLPTSTSIELALGLLLGVSATWAHFLWCFLTEVTPVLVGVELANGVLCLMRWLDVPEEQERKLVQWLSDRIS